MRKLLHLGHGNLSDWGSVEGDASREGESKGKAAVEEDRAGERNNRLGD